MNESNLQTFLIFFVALTAVAVLMQAGVLLGMFLMIRKAVGLVQKEADEYRGKFEPLIDSGSKMITTGKELMVLTDDLVRSMGPDLKAAVADMAGVTAALRQQVERVQAEVDEISVKVHQQADRVDGMTTSFLNGVDRAGRFLNEAVNAPIRQFNGVFAAARAVVETLRAPAPPRAQRVSADAPSDEKDLFV